MWVVEVVLGQGLVFWIRRVLMWKVRVLFAVQGSEFRDLGSVLTVTSFFVYMFVRTEVMLCWFVARAVLGSGH